uniref:Non-specific serine/threonine protein kinase n=1 Tax=Setaria digitata TaxID=48799 RepID=A0A915Q0U5_9BILA
MDRLSKALNVLQTTKKAEQLTTSSKKMETCGKEHAAFLDIKDALVRSEIWKDSKHSDEFNQAMKVLFDYMNHRNSDLRMLSEQTMDSVLRHFVIDMNTSRVVVILMSEIKRNGPSRSLVFALSRLRDVLKHVKLNRSRAIGMHLVSSLSKILIRPEEVVQTALERYLPPIFAFIGSDFETQRSDNVMKLYETALSNLELPGVTNRAAAVVISQLATYVEDIRRKAFLYFLKVLSEASEERNRNLLVGTLNSLRLLWSVYLVRNSQYELESLRSIIRDSLRCLFSSHCEIVVASLEFLEKVVSSQLSVLDVESFYPQQSSTFKSSVKQDITVPTSLPSSDATSCMSPLRASPVNFLFGGISYGAINLADNNLQSSFNLSLTAGSSGIKVQNETSSEGAMDVIDPLRHLEISSDLTKYSSSSEESTPEFTLISSTTIPEQLPVDISFDSFLTYTAVLLAKRFLLSGQCFKLLTDNEVRVSHKILAMSCLGNLALYLPGFVDISVQPKGGLGVQKLKDLQLYLNHEDDQLKAAVITVFINAEKCRFQTLGGQFHELRCSFTSFVYDAIRIRRAHCSRSLLIALQSAKKLVYQTGLIHDIATFACENYRDNYFLLRIAVVEYLASIEWAFATSPVSHLPDEIFDVYMDLLADDDQRVRNAAAKHLSLLTKNANYTSTSNNFAIEEPSNYLCSDFPKNPLTIGMSPYYDFVQQPFNFITAGNLSFILRKMFHILTTSANEKQQAGVAAGLFQLLCCFKSRHYAEAWGLELNINSSRIGLITALISKCDYCCTDVQSFIQFLDIATHMTAGLYTVNIMKEATGNNDTVSKFPKSFIYEHLILLQLRVINLYYSLIIDYRQQIAYSSARPSPLSPVRKALPVSAYTMSSWEQRIAAISTFTGVDVKMSRNTSFLQSSSLVNFVDSLKGGYLNYMNTLASDASERFTALLISALKCLACTLEVMKLPQVADILEEILLYCQTVIEIVPDESIRVTMQLFKILFGSNVANLSLDALKSLKLKHINQPKDLFEVSVLRSANFFTEFLVNTGRVEYSETQLMRCAGWLRKDLISKDGVPASAEIASHVTMFEPFVSLSIRLYQSTNSVDVQCSVLDLLCVLIRGGINYSMLDPETRLLNFVMEQVNEIGTRNRIVVDADERLLNAIFNYFLSLSHTESRGQVIMGLDKIRSLVDFLIKACDVRSYLTPCALNCLRTVLIDCVVMRLSLDISLLKMLQTIEQLAVICPTRVLQLWILAALGSHINGDAQNWTKISLFLFESLQRLPAENWDFATTFNAIILLRSCCTTITRPLDCFFKKMISILEDDLHCFSRLLVVLPYLFLFLCVLKEGSTFTRIEQICDHAAEKIGRLLMILLGQCLVALRRLTSLDYVNEESIENLVVWYLLILSHAVRSGNMESITSTFDAYFSIDPTDLQSLSIFYPRAYAQLFAFVNAAGFHRHKHLFYSSSSKQLDDLCVMTRCRTTGPSGADDVVLLSDSCSPDVFLTVVYAVDLDIVELIAFTDIPETSVTIEFLKNKLGQSGVLDCLIAILLHVRQNKNVAFKTLLTDLVTSEQFSPDFLLKCFEEIPEVYIKNHNLRIGDPMKFTSEVFADLLQQIIGCKSFDIQAEFLCIMLCNVEEKYAEAILRKAYECKRYDVLSSFIDMLDQFKIAEECSGELYNELSTSSPKVDALSALFVSLAFDPSVNSSQLFVQSRLANKPGSIAYKKASDWVTESTLFDHWIQRYVDSLEVHIGPETSEAACAVAFGITRHSFRTAIDQAQNSKKVVKQQLSLAVSVARLVHRVLERCNTLPCQRLQKLGDPLWNMKIIDRTGKKDFDIGFFSDAIRTAFDVTQKIQEIFRRRRLKTQLYSYLERLAKGQFMFAVSRLPFLNDISCIPRSAILCGWKPEPEIHRASISIPTVNIHYLGNVDILQDFVWRILWAGWNRRSNFDNFSMSLFGVISSTPSGSELANANMNMTEQLMASTVAIEGLTNLLLETLLYPERGNPVTGRFIVKPRDASPDFLSTSYGQRLTMLRAKLLGAAVVDSIHRKNLEILNDRGKKYRPGQFSVLTSWNMAGVLDQERNLYKDIMQISSQSKGRLPSSDSSYLLNSGHDTTYESCLRMLFDTYSHWFRAGVDAVPLPLLSATVKSMSLLSDLFTEMDQYRFVFGHMKTLFSMRSYLDNLDIGNIIYSLLKCVSILGIEDSFISKVDAQKIVLTWVETGLTSEFTEIRIRTLQGCLFLLQAISYDELKPVFLFLESFLVNFSQMRGLEEGRVQHLGTQPYDPRIHLMEQHAMIFKILAEGAEEDALQLMKVLPHLLIDSLNQSELINSILKELIHRYTSLPHPRSAAIFTIIHHWFIVLHSRETESVVLEWTLNGLDSFKYIADPSLFRFYVTAFLCSSSPNPCITNLFYLVIGRTSNLSGTDDLLFEFSVRSLLLRVPSSAVSEGRYRRSLLFMKNTQFLLHIRKKLQELQHLHTVMLSFDIPLASEHKLGRCRGSGSRLLHVAVVLFVEPEIRLKNKQGPAGWAAKQFDSDVMYICCERAFLDCEITWMSAGVVSRIPPNYGRKVPEGELCAVCSDLATGYHYGVASCNGCKTFFRRTIVSEHTFVCQYQGNCDVNKNIRCACRHCRFNKCVAVGMDAKAIQNDRDRIGPTKKMKMSNQNSEDDCGIHIRSAEERLIERLLAIEKLCMRLRQCVLPEISGLKEAVCEPSLVNEVNNLKIDPYTTAKELYIATLKDIQMWNKREMRVGLEWAKTFDLFNQLSLDDRIALIKNFGFTFNLLNRNYYAPDHGADKLVLPNGAYIRRQVQNEVKLPGCRSIYHRQMDEIMLPFRQLKITMPEFALFKASVFFNPDAINLSPLAKSQIYAERSKYLSALFYLITSKCGITMGAQKYGSLLMMASSVQNIIAQNEENMQVMDFFEENWKMDNFVKEVCLKDP